MVKHISLDMAPRCFPIPSEVQQYYNRQVAVCRDAVPATQARVYSAPPASASTSLIGPPELPLGTMASLCPNIETLEFFIRRPAMVFNLCPPGSLMSLRSILAILAPRLNHDRWEVARLKWLFLAAPNLSLLQLLGHCSFNPQRLTLRLEAVKEIRLVDAEIGWHSLVNLLRLCPKVESLHCLEFPHWWLLPLGSPNNVALAVTVDTTPAVAHVVLEYAPNLRHLELDIADTPHHILGSADAFLDRTMRKARSALGQRGIESRFYVRGRAVPLEP